MLRSKLLKRLGGRKIIQGEKVMLQGDPNALGPQEKPPTALQAFLGTIGGIAIVGLLAVLVVLFFPQAYFHYAFLNVILLISVFGLGALLGYVFLTPFFAKINRKK